MSELVTYDSREALFAGLAFEVATQLVAALAERGRATLAVPGGATPAPFFEKLRKCPLDWRHVTVVLTDERFVPEDSERSNTRLVRHHLMQENAAEAELIGFYLPKDRPEDILDELTNSVAKHLPLDVCVLGMGADMHIASLFPGADLLEQALADDAPVLLPMRAEGIDEPRITLTAPVLSAADAIHLLIAGKEKLQAYQVAAEANSSLYAPVRVVLGSDLTTRVHYAD
ncbi:MAG: 6-phosphogluconolactonase [Rhodobacteraceae bacterium]|nr:6-phosphogluconolactonase [Paracoccaceae bacterium]